MAPLAGAREAGDRRPSSSDLEVLMVRYQQGDLAAATALVHRLSPQLHRFFSIQFAVAGDADDLLQETWLRIHKVRHTYRAGEPLLPWLYAIARHIRVDHYRRISRRSAREHPLEEAHETPAPAPGPAATPDFAALLAPLPPGQREVIEMLKGAGMSLEEVAHTTSSSVGAVKQKAHRAYEITEIQLHAGTVNVLTVLNTQTALFNAEDALVQVRFAHLQALVQLFNALGGGWQQPAGAT